MGREGRLKLSDFGLAKEYGCPDRDLSPQACTLEYRAPELLYGAKAYGAPADMWAVGCIFAEMISKRTPFFQNEAQTEAHQLAVCGVVYVHAV